ncbi:hypothetical protein NIASO_03640 [Niabella soli DSM 19437]|uniref:Uncharacterized protein n=1 Tax=Niabella soli DSM 19437 TaxID=929713 RepID=W0F5X1_9BACT|nr:hypothetical protein NIASO_03640 [Niabella soli DSM 19437]
MGEEIKQNEVVDRNEKDGINNQVFEGLLSTINAIPGVMDRTSIKT